MARTSTSVRSLRTRDCGPSGLRLIVGKAAQQRPGERDEALGTRQLIRHVHGRLVAQANHFSDRVRPRRGVQSASQDDVIDLLVDERRAQAIEVCSR